MALRFRLRGLAETFLEAIRCPCCGQSTSDEQSFKTDLSRVTPEGIVVVAQCDQCSEIFVPDTQRLGVMNMRGLRTAVEKDSQDTGEPLYSSLAEVRLNVERLNVQRKTKGLN